MIIGDKDSKNGVLKIISIEDRDFRIIKGQRAKMYVSIIEKDLIF